MKPSNIAAFGALALVVALIYSPVFGIPPFEGDNLYVLSWADRARPADLLAVDADIYPEWRPLSYATVWLQYRWAELHDVWSYYLVNAVLWALCGWLVFRLVHELTASIAPAIVSAAIVLTSPEIIDSMVLIVDRQTSLACLFGLAVWLMLVRIDRRPPTRLECVAVSALLAASAASKEYGLAFAGAVAVSALHARRRQLAMAALAAIAVYGGMRIVFAGGAVAPLCEDQGYFTTVREVCVGRLDPAGASQAVYNVIATAVGSVLPGVFAAFGQVAVSVRWLAMSVLVFLLAVWGWTKGPPPVRLGLLIIGFNALLSVALYRSRNQAAPLCAVAIAAGCGGQLALSALGRLAPSRLTQCLVGALLLTVVSVRGLVVRELVTNRAVVSSRPDACAQGVPRPDARFMQRVWQTYHLLLPECRDQ